MFGKRILALAAILAAAFTVTSCKGDGPTALSGNLGELSTEPGDIFAVFEFLDYGEVTFKLFPEIAPTAVEKFTELAERGYYTKRNIHRVLKDYIFQGGSVLFDGTDGVVQEPEYFPIETSEFAKHFFGALCFAADDDGNNYRQIYVVCNRNPVDIDADIAKLEAQINDSTRKLTEEAKTKYTGYLNDLKAIPESIKEQYASRSGVYSLDGLNTVFGQVTEGQDVIDAIAQAIVVEGNSADDNNGAPSKPLDEIIIEKVTIVRIPLPEPTTISSEESTKKKKKTTATTVDPNSPEALTDKVNFGEETTVTVGDGEEEAEQLPEGSDESAASEIADDNQNTEDAPDNPETGENTETAAIDETSDISQ